MNDNTEIELLLDQTVSALQEIATAVGTRKSDLNDSIVGALAGIAQALAKRQPLDLTPIIREMVALRSSPAIQVLPAPVQFLPCPDAIYEVEVHPTVAGRQRMTISKSTPK